MQFVGALLLQICTNVKKCKFVGFFRDNLPKSVVSGIFAIDFNKFVEKELPPSVL